eukprot:TRINITY_DN2664_c0_g1_i1.p2 TRINITY_DN2664_c0_g1~~TRINITY_DN2664_c0_g1_i1.p2  ORF type:complete len:55 (+),score=31.23 TRINITY_DN2664_c0_g1_i1:220-384(+)
MSQCVLNKKKKQKVESEKKQKLKGEKIPKLRMTKKRKKYRLRGRSSETAKAHRG